MINNVIRLLPFFASIMLGILPLPGMEHSKFHWIASIKEGSKSKQPIKVSSELLPYIPTIQKMISQSNEFSTKTKPLPFDVVSHEHLQRVVTLAHLLNSAHAKKENPIISLSCFIISNEQLTLLEANFLDVLRYFDCTQILQALYEVNNLKMLNKEAQSNNKNSIFSIASLILEKRINLSETFSALLSFHGNSMIKQAYKSVETLHLLQNELNKNIDNPDAAFLLSFFISKQQIQPDKTLHQLLMAKNYQTIIEAFNFSGIAFDDEDEVMLEQDSDVTMQEANIIDLTNEEDSEKETNSTQDDESEPIILYDTIQVPKSFKSIKINRSYDQNDIIPFTINFENNRIELGYTENTENEKNNHQYIDATLLDFLEPKESMLQKTYANDICEEILKLSSTPDGQQYLHNCNIDISNYILDLLKNKMALRLYNKYPGTEQTFKIARLENKKISNLFVLNNYFIFNIVEERSQTPLTFFMSRHDKKIIYLPGHIAYPQEIMDGTKIAFIHYSQGNANRLTRIQSKQTLGIFDCFSEFSYYSGDNDRRQTECLSFHYDKNTQTIRTLLRPNNLGIYHEPDKLFELNLNLKLYNFVYDLYKAYSNYLAQSCIWSENGKNFCTMNKIDTSRYIITGYDVKNPTARSIQILNMTNPKLVTFMPNSSILMYPTDSHNIIFRDLSNSTSEQTTTIATITVPKNINRILAIAGNPDQKHFVILGLSTTNQEELNQNKSLSLHTAKIELIYYDITKKQPLFQKDVTDFFKREGNIHINAMHFSIKDNSLLIHDTFAEGSKIISRQTAFFIQQLKDTFHVKNIFYMENNYNKNALLETKYNEFSKDINSLKDFSCIEIKPPFFILKTTHFNNKNEFIELFDRLNFTQTLFFYDKLNNVLNSKKQIDDLTHSILPEILKRKLSQFIETKINNQSSTKIWQRERKK